MDDTARNSLTYATSMAERILIANHSNGLVTAVQGRFLLEIEDCSDDTYLDIRTAIEQIFSDVEDDECGFSFELGHRIDREVVTGVPTTGFHVLDDTATRSTVVGHFDGTDWWLPGSERPFEQHDVMGPDGSNAGGRFNRGAFVEIHVGGADWKPTYGRVA